MRHQGKYPVIYFTLKGVTGETFTDSLKNLSIVFAELYEEHKILLNSPHLFDIDKENFLEILNKTVSENLLKCALFNLSCYLSRHYGKQPIILIDECDVPIKSAYHHGYYEDMAYFISYLFGSSLKSNPYMYRAVLAGTVFVFEESIFSNLNNLLVHPVINFRYETSFGFLEEEVKTLLTVYHLDEKLAELRSWYGGYHIGKDVAVVYE